MLVRAPTSPLRTRPRVQRAPGIPCALLFSRVNPIKTRAHRAARPRRHVLNEAQRVYRNGPPVIWLGFLNWERAENNESVEVFGGVAPGRRLQATLAAPPARTPSAKRSSANESRMIRDVRFSASGSGVKKAN